jgi:hypothetical protein
MESAPAMKNLGGRLRKLEDRLGVTNEPRLLPFLMREGVEVSQESGDVCLRILDELGLLAACPLVNLLNVPSGLSPQEMEIWARENADDISKIVPRTDECEGTFGRYERLAAERAEHGGDGDVSAGGRQ